MRPHAVTAVGAAVYAYDDNGNMTGRAGKTVTWNVDNTVASAVGPDTIPEGYTYDANGQRATRSRNLGQQGGFTTVYVGGRYEEDTPSGTIRVLYTCAGKVVAQRTIVGGTPTLTYLHGDHLGSTGVTTSSAGAVTATQRYTPWGSVRAGGPLPTSLGFNGQYQDGTGLSYYGARYYDPTTGRFISADSLGAHRSNPQSRNRYSYALNNPLRYTDPNGHDPVDNACEYSGRCGDASPAPASSATTGPSGPDEYSPGEGPQTPVADDPCAYRECHTPEEVPHAPPPAVEPGACGYRECHGGQYEPEPAVTGGECGYSEHCGANLPDDSADGPTIAAAADPTAEQVAAVVVVVVIEEAIIAVHCFRHPVECMGVAAIDVGQQARGAASGSQGPRQQPMAPSESPVWRGLERYRGQYRRDASGNIYNWDRTHGNIERYNSRGQHTGVIDPVTGEQVGPAVPGRTCKPDC